MRMKNDSYRLPRSSGRHPSRSSYARKGGRVSRQGGDGLELCVFEECELGSLERRPELSVIRFTPGFVKTLKSGPFFDECLRFPDGKRHKFAHVVCSDDADLRLEELNLECCTLPECVTKNFKCSRNSDGKDEEGLYLPGKNPEWGCEPEGCLLIERGYSSCARRAETWSMPVPRKLRLHHCLQCERACTKEVFTLNHRFLDGPSSKELVFCSWACLLDHFEVMERMLEKLHRLLSKEKAELYRRVCPACVSRFHTLE